MAKRLITPKNKPGNHFTSEEMEARRKYLRDWNDIAHSWNRIYLDQMGHSQPRRFGRSA